MYDFSKVNILIVESSEEMAGIFRTVLSMLSVPAHNIDIVLDADEGFREFRRKVHDIVITDWIDDGNKGLELVKRIRTGEDSPSPYVPIIMTAGSGHLSRVIQSRDAGVSEYLVKPFAAVDISKRLTRMIERPKPFIVSDSYVGHERRVKDVPYDGEDRREEEQVETHD